MKERVMEVKMSMVMCLGGWGGGSNFNNKLTSPYFSSAVS